MNYLKVVTILIFLLFIGLNSVYAESQSQGLVKITGFSMYPTLKDGDIKMCNEQLNHEIGDTIVYSKGNNYIAHRIIAKVFDFMITKGDNNTFPDFALVSEDNVICSLEESIPVTV